MKPSLENYALKVLADAGCDCHTYAGDWSKHIMDDLKKAFPDGMLYPYVDVANAILAISRPEPIVRAPYHMVWNTEDCCDGIDFESLEAAKNYALETLINWMIEERNTWKKGIFCPTRNELDRYNYMICNCSVEVQQYDPDTDEYSEVWSPSYEDEEQIGWKELTMKDIRQQEKDFQAGLTSDAASDTLV